MSKIGLAFYFLLKTANIYKTAGGLEVLGWKAGEFILILFNIYGKTMLGKPVCTTLNNYYKLDNLLIL